MVSAGTDTPLFRGKAFCGRCGEEIVGDMQALTALWRKYEELLGVLRRRKKPGKNGMFPERDDFEALSIELIDCAEEPLERYIKIAEDIGTLLIADPVLWQGSFDWLFAHCEQAYGKNKVHRLLAERAKSSLAVEQYLKNGLAWNDKTSEERCVTQVLQTAEDIWKEFEAERKKERESEKSVRFVSFKIRAWIKRTGNTEMLSAFAQKYLSERDAGDRAEILWIFGKDCPFPLSPELLIRDAESRNERLREAAFFALSYMHHEKVREFALELAGRGEHLSEAVILLANHYQEKDRELFVRLVKSIPVTYDDKTGWHEAHSAVLDLLKTKGVKSAPKELLPFLYEREYIVREMGRRRMATEAFWRECLYDSNREIRVYAGRKMGCGQELKGEKL